MTDSNSWSEKVSTRKRIAAEQSDVPVDEQTVAARLDDPDALLARAAEASHDDNLDRRLSPRTDSRGSKYKYDWSRDPAVEPGRRPGETLAAQEKRLGEEAEQERHREVARSAEESGLERARSNRMVEDEREWHRYEVAAGESSYMPLSWKEQADLIETVDEDEASLIREKAAEIRERIDGAPSEGLLRRWMVERVRRGQGLFAAIQDVHREAQRWDGAVQSLSTIRWGDRRATVEVTVETLWDPKDSSQKQVGIIRDDEGETAKFVIWKNSMKTCKLREGDRVRFEEIKVNVYAGQLALAVVSDTEVRIQEKGDGPSRFSTKGTPWSSDEEADHAWVNGMVERHIEKHTDLGESDADGAQPGATE